MKLTGKEARDIVQGENELWAEVPESRRITGLGRWSVQETAVFSYKTEHLDEPKYYRFKWQSAATEVQDEQPFECVKEYCPQEVELKEVMVKQWVPVGGAA